MRCSFQTVKTLLFPEPELLKFLGKKAWKFQIVLAIFQVLFVVFAALDGNEIGFFYVSISVTFRCIMLLCGRCSSKFFLAGCTACVMVDSACHIMAHPEMQNTVWLPGIYERLLGLEAPPCPSCFPDIETSMLFAIHIFYMLLFVLPFCCAACAVPPCLAAYVTCLVYSRWNNYVQFGEEMAKSVKHLTQDELILLSAFFLINITAKIIMEISESQCWYALKESQGTVLHEKILRCEAEYAQECMKTVAKGSEKIDIISSFCTTSVDGHHQTSKSVASAPPVLESQSLKTYYEDEEHWPLQCASPCGGDCLEEGDLVWTNQCPHPIPVKELVKGQQVLCYDHLSKGLKHAEVLNVAMQADSTQWATIMLTDGTSIRVTADHPFLTEAPGKLSSAFGQAPVPASELKPHISKVLVMKLVPVDVQSVELDELEALKEQARISIDIQQPTRHSVFVSRRGQQTPGSAVAVGASNLEVMAQEYVMRAHRTFLDIGAAEPKLRRTNSSPGSLQSIGMASTAQSGSASIKSTSTPTTLSSSVTSVGTDNCTIRIGAKLRPVQYASGSGHAIDAMLVPDGESWLGLSDYLRLQRSGVPSIGSFKHCPGICSNACWFENQRQHGRNKRCSVGILCERCHFDHDILKRGRRGLKL